MAKRRDIVINIDPDGGVTIKVEGVAGGGCLDFTKFLEEELGEVTSREHTSEYYQEEEAETTVIKAGENS